jgi:hypothetical protein
VEVYNVTVDNGFAVKSLGSDTETIPESSTLPFYRYTIVDIATGVTGIIIASGDKRIGNILAYIEDETDDPLAASFMDILAASLSAYVDATIDSYNSVMPAEIEATTQNFSRMQADKKSSFVRSANQSETPKKGTSFLPLIETKWGQGVGYWDMVNRPVKTPDSRIVYNDGALSQSGFANNTYPVGCVAVAMGQIMAFHEWPGGCSLPGDYDIPICFYPSTMITFPFSNIVYDWNAMKAKPWVDSSGMSDDGKFGINVLLYEAGVNVYMKYSKRGSSASTETDVVPAFGNLGYDISESAVRDYNYNTIVTSIDRHQPVIIAAKSHLETTTTYPWFDVFHWFPSTTITTSAKNGHAWIIDDYDVRYETVYSGGQSFQRPVYEVHCNFGWNGGDNGWYPSGLFDTTRNNIDDTQRSVSPGVLRSTHTEGDFYV